MDAERFKALKFELELSPAGWLLSFKMLTSTYLRAARQLFALCLAFTAIVAAAEAGEYRTLDWADLIPADWKRPIILPAPPEDGDHHAEVDEASLEHDLEGQHIELPGFMIPIKFEQNVVSELLFVPFLQRHTSSHMHHDPNQMIYVYLEEPVPVQNPYIAVTVKGVMKVASVQTDEGPTGYTLTAGLLEAYVY